MIDYGLKRLRMVDLRKGQIVLMVSYDSQDFAQDDEQGWSVGVMRVVGIGAECEGHVGKSFLTDMPNAMLEFVKDRRIGDSVALGGSLGHMARDAAEAAAEKTHDDYMHVCDGEDGEFDAFGGYGDCALLLLAEHGMVEACCSCAADIPVELLKEGWCAECETARSTSTKSRMALQAELGEDSAKLDARYEEMKSRLMEAGFAIDEEDKFMRYCSVFIEMVDAPRVLGIAAPYLATGCENHSILEGVSPRKNPNPGWVGRYA